SVLQELKQQWGAFTGSATWLPGNDCGTFNAVTCNTDGDVTALDLGYKGLIGSIPTSIGTLSQLSLLVLTWNQLKGPLPASFVNLTALIEMDASYNQLNGTIPASYSRLSSLWRLRLYNNQLTGSIPGDVLSAMLNLRQLLLYNNQLSGTIPSQISDLPLLTEINVRNNQLTGPIPSEISRMKPIQSLTLAYNQLSGTAPELSMLTNLNTLALTGNQFSGTIPSQYSELKNLRYMYLHKNSFSGSLPSALSALTGLSGLLVVDNQLSGTISVLSTLSNLSTLDLSSNNFSGRIPSGFSNLKKLRNMYLDSNSFSGSIPGTLSAMASLVQVDISDNLFSGSLPSGIKDLLSLQLLLAARCGIQGDLPGEITNLGHLLLLDLSDNDITGPLPSFGSLTSLRYLDLRGNGFTGSIPAPTNLKTALTYLNLARNALTGSIPETISNVAGALTIDFSGNSLIDSIPASMFELKRLQNIVLGSNKLSGDLPSTLTQLTDLTKLDLSSNQISGSLPTILSLATFLSHLDLSNNRLHGTIPTQLTGLVRLSLLNLRNNQLTGPVLQPIPANLTVYDLDNNYLSSGFSSPPNCSQGSISFRFNCLQTPTQSYSCLTPATPSAADAAVQRPEELCDVFCGVSAADPPCGGHGSCYVDGPSRVPTCDCESGFVNGELPGSCVPEGSQEGGPVIVQPTAAQTAVKGRAAVASNGRITLTASQPITWGAAFLQLPIPLFSFALKAGACGRPLAFTIYFSFSILKPAKSRKAAAATAATAAVDAGDGFAFVIAATDAATGGSSGSSNGSGGGGSLGYAGMDERSIAVEFDTARSTDANDPAKSHVGVSVRGNTSSIATAKAPFTLNDGKSKHAWIVFEPSPSSCSSTTGAGAGYGSCSSGTGWLRVFLSAKGSPRPGKAVLAMQVSLCEFLQPSAAEASFLMGFTASSSDSPQLHSILTWNITTGGLMWVFFRQRPHPPQDPCIDLISKPSGGPFRVNGFERTAFHGWFGLLLAVQRQPVVVHVQATAPSFLNYDGLSKYADPSCFTYNLNHVVLLVGYRLTGLDPTFPHMAPPFWIIRNSWGPEWGDGGHMRMDIQGGDGVCGINTLPGIYPVVRAARTPATAAVHNPCAVGTCVNDGKGSYSCVCPPGFRQGTTVDGTFSCAPGDSSSTYTVVSWGVTCADIHPVYGLTLAQLQAQNPDLSCSTPLAVGMVVNVVQPADLMPCSVYYTTSQGDTCESLATYFSLTAGCPTPTEPCAAAFQALNPGLDCSGSGELVGSQAVCVERRAESAAALLIPVCSQFYLVQAGETCDQIRSVPSPPLSPLEFFRLNPGIKCSRLVPKTDVGSLTGFE
ncbi:unnamed protein product, partial [Closterium sp. Naga37s-1]